MKNDACDMATEYAERLMKARDLVELGQISSEIKARLNDMAGFEDWLRDIYKSAYNTLISKKFKPEEVLNNEGMKALKRGEITYDL